jgi:hypothetical protein
MVRLLSRLLFFSYCSCKVKSWVGFESKGFVVFSGSKQFLFVVVLESLILLVCVVIGNPALAPLAGNIRQHDNIKN